MSLSPSWALLPGAELVSPGLDDLRSGRITVEALLVSIGAPRLRRSGVEVPSPVPDPEHRLYELLAAEDPDGAHSRFTFAAIEPELYRYPAIDPASFRRAVEATFGQPSATTR